MNSWDLRAFRNDLSIFIKKIGDYNIEGEFSSLNTILENLENKALVSYKLESICFYVNSPIAGTFPDNLHFFQIYLDNMLMVKDELDLNTDPLYAYYLNIYIQAYKSQADNKKVHFSSWHLDKHKNENVPRYTHPTYHFQFGGKKMELLDDQLAILASPRIPHPPMDIFLGVHFIISNFFNNRQYGFVNKLLADYDYQQIIKRAQNRLWKPYFKAFDSSNIHNDFTMNNIFPLYLS
ncbi:MAG: hypothetical protein VB126_02415 [Paludibacter sp.]|nr:hypothetical protein [Paludibacter sp.]